MARSTYYFEINKTDPVAIRNEELLLVIKKIFVENKGRYGVRRVYMELKNRGYNVNHKRVQRLMHDAGLFGKRPKEKYHSYKGEVGKVADNVINRNFSTTLPLQKWTTDVSQFNFSWGKCYLSPILDMNTNEIISYDLALSPNLEQIKRMLDKAFDKYSSVNGLILHSDQGWQYQHAYYRNRLKEHGIIQSMSRKGYQLTATVRRDGTSRFAKGNQWGTFPSVAVAWRLSEESFWRPLKDVVNNFKLRLSYGEVGNSNVSAFAYQRMGTYVQSIWGTSLQTANIANPDLTWE